MAPFVYREAPEKFDFSRFDHRGRVEVRYLHILLNTLRMIFATCVWLKEHSGTSGLLRVQQQRRAYLLLGIKTHLEKRVLNLRVCSDCTTSQFFLNEVGLVRALVGAYRTQVGR